jgi:hypothetical protein
MATWAQFQAEVPEFAAVVEARFTAHKFLTMATVKADGAPRISGTEIVITGGELWVAGMTGAKRWADLRREPRVAIHAAPGNPDAWEGDAKVGGRAVEVTDEAGRAVFAGELPEGAPGEFELFRIDLTEATSVRLEDPPVALIVETWTPGRPLRRVAR